MAPSAPADRDSPPKAAPPRRPGRVRRALATGAATLGLCGVFTGSAALAVVLHLDVGPFRRLARDVANQALGSLFEGKIVISEIDHLALDEVTVRSAVTLDPHGTEIIRAHDIHGSFDLVGFARASLFGTGERKLAFPHVRIEEAEVVLDRGPDQRLGIETAFKLRPTPKKPKKPKKPGEAERAAEQPTTVALERIEIGHAHVRGQVAPPRALDADVTRLLAAVHVGPRGVAVDVEQTGIRERTLAHVPLTGTVDYHLHIDTPPEATTTNAAPDPESPAAVMRMWSSFAGRAGPVEVLARAKLEGAHVTAAVELPRAEPADLRLLAPGLPVRERVSARITLEGDAPSFEVEGRLDVSPTERSPGSVALRGKLDVSRGARLALDVTADDVDPRMFVEGLPGANVDMSARLVLDTNPALRLVAEARTEPMVVQEQAVPAADVHLVYDHDELEGRVTLHEQGAPTSGSFVVSPGGAVRFEAETFVASLEAAPRLRGPATGSARVHVQGAIQAGKIDARAVGSVHELHAKGGVSLERGRVEGRIRGPFEKLDVEAAIEGEGLIAGGRSADKVTAHVRGPVTAPKVEAKLEGGDVGELEASARIETKEKSAREVALRLSREGERIEGKARRVALQGGALAIEGLTAEGPGVGSVEGTLAVDGRELTGKLKGEGVDLGRLGRLLDLDRNLRGLADVDVALTRTKDGRKGHVHLQVEDGTFSAGGLPITGASGSLVATFDDARATMDGSFRLIDRDKTGAEDACNGSIAEVRISGAEGNLRGPLLDPATWSRLTGSARVDAPDWDLRCIARRLPVALVLSEVSGRLGTSFAIERPAGQRFVSVRDLDVRTRGLVVAGPVGFGEDKPAWESRTMDVAVTGSLNGATGATDVTLSLLDTATMVELATHVDLDLPTLVDDPKKRRASLLASRGTAELTIPRRTVRSLQTLPSVLRDALPPIRGAIALSASASGTLEKPAIRVNARGFGLAHDARTLGPSPWAFPVDVDATATYDASKATLRASVRKEARELALVEANADVDLAALRAGRAIEPRGGARATLRDLPLELIPFFADRDIAGRVSGVLRFDQRGVDPEAAARIEVSGLELGSQSSFDRATLELSIGNPGGAKNPARGVAQLELVGRGGGRIDATGYAGVDWEGIVPHIDATRPADLLLKANRFRLAALTPLVSGTLSRLDGSLDGDLRVGLHRFGEDDGRIEANMEVRGGVFHVPQIGQEFKNTRVSIRTTDKGELRFDDLRAEGISGAVEGFAVVQMKGLAFQQAHGELRIDRDEELPVTFEGVPLGHAHGKIVLAAEKEGREVSLTVSVPALHLALPASSTRGVQSLDPNPDVAVSHALGPPKEERPKDALAYLFTFELGDIRIEGMGADLELTGGSTPPRVALTDETRLSGDVEISRGSFEIVGKKFEIERGLVRLRPEEAGNPYVNVTARWDAPDGTRVFVDYVGDLKPITEQKLKFRSSPPMSQQAILSMILIGESPESKDTQSQATAQASPRATDVAAGVVGGEIASAQINAILSQIAPLRGLSTRVGTTEAGRLRTTVIYELGDTVTAQASYEGSPASSRLEGIQSPTGTTQGSENRTELNLDWRFKRNWALRGSFGFGGINQQPSSGLDLFWQYRY
ncbi:translocation/assembly module TamB domain-containing protein [Polyangium sp. y55x31]|uniref:translocation/assembly module TamB domain-containing protein n=1 Tax=Polyangium sp. y55x31 TaxID=3042688 RepID=UPI002482C073|nr:translocation/assembly module TamB domain-containing protein [Polyangium sp. y55x31]MDI1483151.1 translocation/assembly module TamB domain-containing protein [Polyangium sp. y55x31]